VKKLQNILILFSIIATVYACKPEDNNPNYGTLQLVKTQIGDVNLNLAETTMNIPVNRSITITFSNSLDTSSISDNIQLFDDKNEALILDFAFAQNNTEIQASPFQSLKNSTNYILKINNGLKGVNKETFEGVTLQFKTENGILQIESITLNNTDFSKENTLQNIQLTNNTFKIVFNMTLNEETYKSNFSLVGFNHLDTYLANENTSVIATITEPLSSLKKYTFNISAGLTSVEGYAFEGFSNYFYTAIDSTSKFPTISDDDLLTLVQQQTFKFYWDYGHPSCGLSRERLGSGDIVTIGGSGFGIMALIVGTEREFITRNQLIERVTTILTFLESCDRFHGAWPHWINGATGKVIPFGSKDDGADLVETSFLIQGLLTLRQYLNENNSDEEQLISRINELWQTVEWDWFTRDQNVLYWHWSPNTEWSMNMQIRGYNEALITYVLAASSTSHTINADVFHNGFMQNGSVINGKEFYGYKLPLGYDKGGPLFFAHYSFLGLNPKNLNDQYANYWEQNKNHTLINRAYCISNPNKYLLYSSDCWGLTASDNQDGYSAHSPTNDLGVITPTAAISSMPYTPDESMMALRFFYYTMGDKLWGEYGFYDAFNPSKDWWASSYISIDQGPIICMIENYRTGLLWNLYMSCPEIQAGLDKLGFTY